MWVDSMHNLLDQSLTYKLTWFIKSPAYKERQSWMNPKILAILYITPEYTTLTFAIEIMA